MKDAYFVELNKCSVALTQELQLMSDDEKANVIASLQKTIEQVLSLHNISRKDGILAFEETCKNMSDDGTQGLCKRAFQLIVDGTAPELVEENLLAMLNRFSNDNEKMLEALIYYVGAIYIQEGINIQVLRCFMKSIVPAEVEQALKKTIFAVSEYEITMADVEKMYTSELISTPEDDWYYFMKAADAILSSLSGEDMKKVLSNVDNTDISVALKLLSGKTIKNVMTNISPKLAIMIYEDMSLMGPLRQTDIVHSVKDIIDIVKVLAEQGEIHSIQDNEAAKVLLQ